LQSKFFPDDYPNNIDCYYTITAAEGMVIQLVMEAFELESHPSCNYDYLELSDNSGYSSGRLCGDEVEGYTHVSGGNSVTVVFHTDYSVTLGGFSLHYEAVTVPGGWFPVELDDPEVQRLLHDFYYPTTGLTENHVELEAVMGQVVTGMYYHFTFITANNQTCNATIFVHLTESIEQHTCEPLFPPNCGELDITTGSGGYLQSIDYPNDYPNYVDCTYTITAPEGMAVRLRMESFDLESATIFTFWICNYDYLELSEPSGYSSGRLCGDGGTGYEHQSTGNLMHVMFHTDGSVTRQGFSLHYEAVVDCGEVNIAVGNGYLQSIGYPGDYPNNVNCTYTLTAEEGMEIRVIIEDFDLENDTACDYDSLELSDASGYSTGKMCGDEGLGYDHVFIANVVTVWFHTDSSVTEQGFSLHYEAVAACGPLDLVAGSGYVQSVDYPNEYPNNVDCAYTITAQEGMVIRLMMEAFKLEPSDDCHYDYLELSDDGGYSSGRLCGETGMGYDYLSVGHVVNVVFHTDPSVTREGFSLHYEAVADCGLTSIAAGQGNLTSLAFPLEYPNNVDCAYTFTAQEGMIINFTMDSFALEGEPGCEYDYVELYDDSGYSSGRLCGTAGLGYEHVSAGTVMYLVFHTDYSVTLDGFSLHYEAIADCGDLIVEAGNGDLPSVNYPNQYPNFVDCSWTITAQEGMVIHINITSFDVEYEDTCDYDYVELSDASGYSSGRMCGDEGLGFTYLSVGNNVTVVFHTDYSIVGDGFSLHYEALWDCGEVNITAGTGDLWSIGYPNDYPNLVDCTYTITSEEGMAIKLNMTAFDLEEGDSCDFDYVEFIDDSGYSSGRLCGTAGLDYVHMSADNVMHVVFHTDYSVTHGGFFLHYEEVPRCGPVNIEAGMGYLQSINYPDNYPNNVDCTYTLTAQEGLVIHVAIEVFDLEYQHECDWDYLELTDASGDSSGRLCGDAGLGYDHVFNGNVLTVAFSTDSSNTGQGFSMHYEAVSAGCRELNIEAGNGRITSVDFPNAYPNNVDCTYTVTAPEGMAIRFVMETFNLQSTSRCYNQDYFVLTEPGYSSTKLCGDSGQDYNYRTEGNVATVTFHSNPTVTSPGFSLHYEVAEACVDTWTARKCRRRNVCESDSDDAQNYCPRYCDICP